MQETAINLLNYTSEDRRMILKTFNTTSEFVAKDVQVLKEWLRQQPHLPEVTSDNQIERFYLLNNCSIEKTKLKLDMYYTIRSLIPEFYDNTNPKLTHMQQIADVGYFIPLPKLNENFLRINVIKINDTNLEKFDPYAFFSHNFNVLEIRLTEDYMRGDVLLFDMDGFTFGHLSKVTPGLLMKVVTIAERVFSNKMKELHYINCPSFINTVISLAKSVLKPKIADRIKVHPNIESLYKYIPKKMLPKDYGGEEKSLAELNELLKQKLMEYQDRFDKLENMRVNEKLRPYKLENDEVLGYYGNFKQLCLD